MHTHIVVVISALAIVLSAAKGEPKSISGIQMENLYPGVRPQDDLFDYANGTWLRKTAIPADRSRWGVDSMMTERSLEQQRALEEAAQTSPDKEIRKVEDFYASFMDEAGIQHAGAQPLQPELNLIASIRSVRDLAPLLARLDRIGVPGPFSSYVYPDAKRSDRYALWLDEDGLGLPERDYYSSNEPKFVEIRGKYRTHISAMLRLLGAARPDADADNILALESKLAALHWSAVDARDPQKTHNPMTTDQLRQLVPQIDWAAFLAGEDMPTPTPRIIVREPDYLKGVSALLIGVPIDVWKTYLRYRLLSAAAPYLSSAFVEEDFAFNDGVLHGTPKIEDRWKRACETIDQLMGEASGKLYVAHYFRGDSKARVSEMISNLLNAYAASIRQLDWMSPATKAQALDKLRKITVKVGYPDHWRDYGALQISSNDLLGNVFRARAFESAREHTQLAGLVNRSEWDMTAPTVDAYYNPATNEITFPAGILQPPLYDPAADDAYNYGSTGATIGHEISHGFDNRGSQYDSDGNLRDWWLPEDHRRFKVMTDRLVAQFDAFEPIPGYHVNGALTLPENMADLAGLEIAYKAYIASLHGRTSPVIDGLTGAKRFFIGYAQSYLGKRREALLIAQLKNNPHAPERYRVNGVVMNLDSFVDAFGVKRGDKMYLPPGARVRPW
ncbi:MAG TPA: M13 family metallopeptidase [Rhizomicrobium sp.]|jgi:predicted metalloendopeptidase